MAKNMMIQVEVVSDKEMERYLNSYNIKTNRFDYIVNPTRAILDYKETAAFPLNFQIADVEDIANKTSSFSKTLNLPASKKNRDTFKLIAELGFDNSSNGFNPNRRTKCYVTIDGILVFEGYLQLKSHNANPDGEEYFEAVLYSVSANFYKEMGESLLQDLVWDQKYKYDRPFVVNSWDPLKQTDYFCPLIDYGWNLQGRDFSGTYGTQGLWQENFYPGFYLKTFIDKIFAQSGFQYQSEFLESERFKSLIIPYNGPNQMTRRDFHESGDKTKTYGYDKTFRAYRTVPFAINTTTNVHLNPSNKNHEHQLRWSHAYYSGDFVKAPSSTGCYWNTNDPLIPVPAVNSNTYQNLSPEGFKQRLVIGLQMYAHFAINSTLPCADLDEGSTNINKVEVVIYREFDNANLPITGSEFNNRRGKEVQVIVLKDTTSNPQEVYKDMDIQWGTYNTNKRGFNAVIRSNILTNYTHGNYATSANVRQNEHIRINIRYYSNDGSLYTFTMTEQCYLYNEVYLDTTFNSTIDVANIVPQGIKQRDLMAAVTQTFNLLIEPHPTIPNVLVIEPRDAFYEKGRKLDWSKKVDLSKEIKNEFLSNTQSLSTKFTMKDDKDHYGTTYKDKYAENYGSFTYLNLNDFATGEKKIDSIFSGTILGTVPGMKDVQIPMLFDKDASLKFYSGTPVAAFKGTNIRLMCVKVGNGDNSPTSTDPNKRQFTPSGEKMRLWKPWLVNTSGSFSDDYPWYPYAGNYDNLYNPKFDTNWYQPYALFYQAVNGRKLSGNNVINDYWMNYMDELCSPTSRLFTCYIKLTPRDINRFSFGNSVYIDIADPRFGYGQGQYFKVNKIIDHDLSSEASTKVELVLSNTTTVIPSLAGPGPNGYRAAPPTSSSGGFTPGTIPSTSGPASTANGTGIISGNFVTVATIPTVEESIPGATTPYNAIEGGRDQVLDPFSISTTNVIQGGVDEVRGIGGVSVINVISGGRY